MVNIFRSICGLPSVAYSWQRGTPALRLLFCTPSTALSGGIKVIFELINRLGSRGIDADLFSFAGGPLWFPLHARVLPQKNLEDVDFSAYDFVLLSNAFMVPMALSHTNRRGIIYFCQDYESFHHARGLSYAECVQDSPAMARIYQLPVPIIAISRSIQQLVKERAGRDSYFMPLGIDKDIFRPQPRKPRAAPHRILLVGNYLISHKGMRDGLDALAMLGREHPVQLVLVTQESRNREVLERCACPVEIHYCCPPERVPQVMSTCDAYCCTSWYEGFGLPAVEAFHCGLPVVSTRTMGVSDYGIDGINLLLAQPNDPADLRAKLERVLLDPALQARLIEGGFATVQNRFDWETSLGAFLSALEEIQNSPGASEPSDPATMNALLAGLEREGSLTPIAVFRQFQKLAKEVEELLALTISRSELSPADAAYLAGLRDQFAIYLENPRAEYYDAFKEKYDLCRLALSLRDSERCTEYLQLIRNRGRGDARPSHGGRDPSPLVEIRYSHA